MTQEEAPAITDPIRVLFVCTHNSARSQIAEALLTRDGASKIVEACTYPLTGVGCVTRVYTDKAVFLTGPDGVQVRETFGCTLEELQAMVPMPLRAADPS